MKLLLAVVCLLIFKSAKAQSYYYLQQDTTIQTRWPADGSILEVKPGVKIHGTGIIGACYIAASMHQVIFDTTLDLRFKGNANGGRVSTMWFGATPSNLNNTRYFQKAVDLAQGAYFDLFTPRGIYIDSGTVHIMSIYQGEFSGVTLRWYGEYVYQGSTAGTVIKYTQNGMAAINVQRGKGVVIDGFSFEGPYRVPTFASDPLRYSSTYDQWTNGYNTHMAAIMIDYYISPITPQSGSTGTIIRNCHMNNFTNGINVSPMYSLNNEANLFELIDFGNLRNAILSNQGQEKGNAIRNCRAWGAMRYFFVAGMGYSTQCGNYHIYDINIAGSVIEVFYIVQQGWFPINIDNVYAESISGIGTLSTGGAPLSISNSVFQFAKNTGNQYLAKTQNLKIQFSNTFFTYFDGNAATQMAFNGIASYFNCHWDGVYTNNVTGSQFITNCQFRN